MTYPALDIKNLVKTYPKGNVTALDGLDLQVEAGDFFSLLGMNGAGKTTTIGIITDLVTKTSGTVRVFGYDIDTHINEAKSLIGVVPQEFNFDMFSKCIDIVTTMGGFYGIPYRDAVKRAQEVLSQLGLGDKLYAQARELSGGMKRRLLIARSLIHRPKLLLLDEPTAGVDVNLREGMKEYLKYINQQEEVTIILTTHYLEEVEELCKHAGIMKGGKIVKLGSVTDLLQDLDEQIYLFESSSDLTEYTDTLQNTFGTHIVEIRPQDVAIMVKKGTSITELVQQFAQISVPISGLRPKGNRLEELFISITKN